MDQLEALFLGIARQRGMTWREIAFGWDSAAPKRRGSDTRDWSNAPEVEYV